MEFYDWLLMLDIILVTGVRISILMEKRSEKK